MSRGAQFECVLSADAYPYLGQYEVDGRKLLPAAAAIEFAVAAIASELGLTDGFELRDVRVVDAPLDGSEVRLSCVVEPDGQFRIDRLTTAAGSALVEGRFARELGDAPQRTAAGLDGVASARRSAAVGSVRLGPAYETALARLATTADALTAELDPQRAQQLGSEGYAVHPVIWQLAIELARSLLDAAGEASSGSLSIGTVSLRTAGEPVRQIHAGREADHADVLLLDAAGGVVASLGAVRCQPRARARVAQQYRLQFGAAPPLMASVTAAKRWLVVGDSAVATELHALLLARGQQSWQVSDERFEATGTLNADAAARAAVADFIRSRSVERVIYAYDDAAALDKRVAAPLAAALASIGAWSHAAAAAQARVWIVTQGAHSITPTDEDRPQQGALWGFGVALALEVPKAWGGLIDISGLSPSASELQCALLEIEAGSEDQVALRGQRRFVPRVLPVPTDASQPALALSAGAAYMVTGGLGGLGLEVALRLARRGARALVLLTRDGSRARSDTAIAAKLQAIEAHATRVIVAEADAADAAQLTALAARFGHELPRLAGIVHAAGVVQLGAAADMSPAEIAQVLRAKVDGTLLLERLFPVAGLDFFVCFSSGASVWGSRGLAAYAAASGFMDAWARSRALRGARTLSLNWGMWAHVGMSSEKERAELLAAIGLLAMEPSCALDAMELALQARAPQRVIADMDWSIFRRVYEANAPRRRLLSEVDAVIAAASADTAQPLPEIRERVRAILVQLTGLAPASIDDDSPLNTLGIDSISGLDLQAQLLHEFGCHVPVSEIIQSATLDVLVECAAQSSSEARDAALVQLIHARDPGTAPQLSLQQERLWFLEQLAPNAAVYNVPGVIHVRGELNQAHLQQAFRAVLARHALLRTSFDVVDGAPVAVEHARIELPYAYRDLGARGSDWPLHARDEVRAPFDLRQAPLLRLLVLRVAKDQHVVVMTMHHIVSDAWSLGVLVQELIALHAELAASVPAALPALPIQFADYALWQRTRLERGDYAAGLAYWVRELEHMPRLLELPTDRPRPPVRTGAGALAPFALSQELSQALRDCAKQHAVTPFVVCLAMYATLLHKYSRQAAVCVGVPVAGRERPELRSLIGFFVNTIVLPTHFEPGATVRTLFARVMACAARGLTHQDVPFERVVAALQPPRSASHTPLFQAGLAFQNVPRTSLNVAGADLQMVELDPGVSKFDLHLTILERDGVYEGSLEYDSDLFEAATAQRLVRHWTGLLAQAAATPDLAIDQLSLASDAERRLVVETWNQTATSFGSESCLHRLIEAQVARTPQRVAVECGSIALTYAELDRHANRLAWRLREAGIATGDFVGVFMERSVELVVALLATLKCGAAYVPFDPSYPRARLEFMLRDAGVRLVLSHESLRAQAAGWFDQYWVVNVHELATGGASEALPDIASGDSPAYMLYTSGSTGMPKGALNSQRAICNRLQWMQAEMPLDARDVVLQKTPIGFDVSVWELFWPLIAGARQLLAEPLGHRDPAYLAQLIEDHAVTTLHFVPSMLQTFLEQPGLEQLRSLRRVVCSGEALGKELSDRAQQLWPAAAVYNLYGPTEAAVDVSVWRCDANDPRRYVPIGRPIANTQLYVLDGNLKPLPVGAPGELYIAGVQVGLGYHGRPALTAERFVRNPFGPSGARMYRTGDLARWHSDGTLEYLGRIDQQIKLRGCRIELGEIEQALLAQPGVAQAAVAIHAEHDPQAAQLVAYVVPKQAAVSSDEVLTALRATLPHYMVPSFVVSISELPLSPSGKLDRGALPAPEIAARSAQRTPDDTEREVMTICGELLGRDVNGVNDNFFEMGGHSLMAARLAARMSQRFERRVSVAALLAAPTIERMARLVRGVVESSDDIVIEYGPAVASPTLFLVHPAGGDASAYRYVASQLRSRVRVLGIRSPALTGGTLHTDLESMAHDYLRALRKIQPRGPYALGGWSMGGVVAFDMARQLMAAGEQVNALVVIDSLLPSAATQAVMGLPSHARGFVRDVAAMFGVNHPNVHAAVDDREALVEELYAVYVRALGDAAPNRDEVARRMEVYCAHCDVMLAYRPHALPVRLALILSEEGANAEQLFGSWASLGQCVSKLVVRGDHFSVMNGPNAASVTKVIQRLLDPTAADTTSVN